MRTHASGLWDWFFFLAEEQPAGIPAVSIGPLGVRMILPGTCPFTSGDSNETLESSSRDAGLGSQLPSQLRSSHYGAPLSRDQSVLSLCLPQRQTWNVWGSQGPRVLSHCQERAHRHSRRDRSPTTLWGPGSHPSGQRTHPASPFHNEP